MAGLLPISGWQMARVPKPWTAGAIAEVHGEGVAGGKG